MKLVNLEMCKFLSAISRLNSQQAQQSIGSGPGPSDDQGIGRFITAFPVFGPRCIAFCIQFSSFVAYSIRVWEDVPGRGRAWHRGVPSVQGGAIGCPQLRFEVSPMRQQHSGVRRRPAAFPLERLESRVLLSKAAPKITIQEVALGNQFEVQILGTPKNDAITINDNGTTGAGAITVTTGDGTTFTSTHPISAVAVATGQGSDHVTYNLLSALQTDRIVVASSASLSNINMPTVKGGGNLQFTANRVGAVLSDNALELFASPDSKGKTSMIVNDANSIVGTVVAGVSQFGSMTTNKNGPVSFSMTSTALVDATGTLFVVGSGGSGKNTMSATYSGTNKGDIEVGEGGSGSQDRLAADINMAAGSIGTVGAKSMTAVSDSGKKASVHLAIRRGTDSTSTTGITAKIIAASKSSTAQQTANVVNQTQGKDTIIS